MVLGQWNLIPWFAKERKLKYPTSNARSEELAAKASYKHPWARGQRCIIPAGSFYEPNRETRKHIPWNFTRADGDLWGLAGLWSTWTDKETAEIVESFTMLTLNADNHPLINRMHRPDMKRPPNTQDKRSVVPIDFENVVTMPRFHVQREVANFSCMEDRDARKQSSQAAVHRRVQGARRFT